MPLSAVASYSCGGLRDIFDKMSLTGWATEVLAVLLCAGTLVAALLLWSRVGRFWGRSFLRAGLILVSQLSAVLLVAVLVNDSFGFYTSWREVAGLEHHTVTSPSARPGTADAALRISTLHAMRAGQGAVVSMQIPGTASGVGTLPALVYLPPQYGAPAYAHRTFPVTELIAGAGGHPGTWTHHLNVSAILDAGLHAGADIPMIVVMPTVTVAPPRDTECVNVTNGPQVDTYLTTDVRAAVTHAFRAATESGSWAMLGYSTGGYCAANLALRHPTQFSAAVSLSGYDKPYTDPTPGGLFAHDQNALNANSPIWRLQHLPAPALRLLLVATRDDAAAYRDAQAMAAATRSPLQTEVLTLRHGGHNFSVWRAEEPTAFAWLSHVLTPPLAPIPVVDGTLPTGTTH